MRVLVVDEPRIVAFVTKYLVQAGFDVDSASNGAEALAKIQAQAPDVLVCANYLTPAMDGYQLIKILRDEVRYQETKIILTPAWPCARDDRSPYETKMLSELPNIRRYIHKPFSPAELIQGIYRVTKDENNAASTQSE